MAHFRTTVRRSITRAASSTPSTATDRAAGRAARRPARGVLDNTKWNGWKSSSARWRSSASKSRCSPRAYKKESFSVNAEPQSIARSPPRTTSRSSAWIEGAARRAVRTTPSGWRSPACQPVLVTTVFEHESAVQRAALGMDGLSTFVRTR